MWRDLAAQGAAASLAKSGANARLVEQMAAIQMPNGLNLRRLANTTFEIHVQRVENALGALVPLVARVVGSKFLAYGALAQGSDFGV